jgi:hypothetical protein
LYLPGRSHEGILGSSAVCSEPIIALACHFYLARRILYVLVVQGKQLDDSSSILGQLPVSHSVDLECELNKYLGLAKYNWEVFRSRPTISGLTYRCLGPTELGISTYRRRDCDQVYYAICLDQSPIFIWSTIEILLIFIAKRVLWRKLSVLSSTSVCSQQNLMPRVLKGWRTEGLSNST